MSGTTTERWGWENAGEQNVWVKKADGEWVAYAAYDALLAAKQALEKRFVECESVVYGGQALVDQLRKERDALQARVMELTTACEQQASAYNDMLTARRSLPTRKDNS